MSKRFRKLYAEYGAAREIIRKLAEERQDEAFLRDLQGLSSRQKRMVAAELAIAQREANWKLHEEMSRLLGVLQKTLDEYLLNPALTDYTEPLFYKEADIAIIETLSRHWE